VSVLSLEQWATTFFVLMFHRLVGELIQAALFRCSYCLLYLQITGQAINYLQIVGIFIIYNEDADIPSDNNSRHNNV
jgi:hypothetical protein